MAARLWHPSCCTGKLHWIPAPRSELSSTVSKRAPFSSAHQELKMHKILQQTRGSTDEYVCLMQAALDLGDALPGRRDAAETCTFTVELAGAERSFEVLSYPPGRSQRALRSAASALHLSADDMPAWPASKEVGQAWRSGEWLCIPMTLCYTIDNELRQVQPQCSCSTQLLAAIEPA